MKKNKLKRIFAVIGCVLVMLSVLVVPAAAEVELDPQPVSPADVYPNFYSSLPSGMNTFAYNKLITDMQNGFGSNIDLSWQEYILSSTTLVSGTVGATGYPFYLSLGDHTFLKYIDWSVVINGDLYSALNRPVYVFVHEDTINVEFSDDLDSNGFSQGVLAVQFRYGYLDNSGFLRSEITHVEWRNRSGTVLKEYTAGAGISMNVAFADHYNPDTNGDNGFTLMLGALFFRNINDHICSPYNYYYGYCDGLTDAQDTDAYDRGYQDAVKEIDSGKFGYNLIGGVLSAPFEFLGEFILVSWTFDGVYVGITLADVVSAAIGIALFVWFLKMFAGG